MKEKVKELLQFPVLFEEMNQKEKEELFQYFKLLENSSLERILASIPFNADSFYQFVSKVYVSQFATNQKQEKILLESMMLKRKKEKVEKQGKRKEKFSKSKHQKKQKGKAYAKVRVEKLYFR